MTTAILVALALLGALAAYAASRPNTFRLERSIRIDVAPEVIFGHINDFKRWEAWSPWEKIDPTLARTYSGAASGKGAAYAWVGSGKVGTGRMEIIGSTPFSAIKIKLDFTAPFKASNITDFTLTRDGDMTKVVWAMSGPAPFISKLMGVVFNMDKLVGGDFEKGLAALKSATEGTGYTQLMR
jgi:Polyketide cyclase / dehydrase and lipid transport